MSTIVGILLGAMIFFVLGKAILETIWGLCLIAYGIGCLILATILKSLAKIIRIYGEIRSKCRQDPQRIHSTVPPSSNTKQKPSKLDHTKPGNWVSPATLYTSSQP